MVLGLRTRSVNVKSISHKNVSDGFKPLTLWVLVTWIQTCASLGSRAQSADSAKDYSNSRAFKWIFETFRKM